MTSISLGASYLTKAATRLKVLDLLLREQAYSDVVREAQEVVELALKGMTCLGPLADPVTASACRHLFRSSGP